MAGQVERDRAVRARQMRNLLVPGMAVAAGAMNHDYLAAFGKIRDDLGQRGLTRIVHVDRVAVDIDVLGRHRRSPLIRAFAGYLEGLVFGSRVSCQTQLGVGDDRNNGDHVMPRIAPQNSECRGSAVFGIGLKDLFAIWTPEAVEFVRMQTWMARIQSQLGERLSDGLRSLCLSRIRNQPVKLRLRFGQKLQLDEGHCA